MLKREPKFSRKQSMDFAGRMLARKKLPDDIAAELSRQGDMSWDEAAEIVEDVSKNHRGAIARHKAPGMIMWSVLLLVVGLYLIMLNGQVLLNEYGFTPPLYNQFQGTDLPLYGRVYGGDDMIQFAIGGFMAGGALLGILLGIINLVR